jgi:tetratricopeptide (TPR) repeat protein
MRAGYLLSHILEADSSELSDRLVILSKDTFEFALASALLAYWRFRIVEFEDWARSPLLPEEWRELLRVRVALRKNEKYSGREPPFDQGSGIFEAERAFVWALYFETCGADSSAKELYLQAQKLFQKNGMKRKAVKSYHNAIAAESRIHPQLRLIPEYQEAVRLAKAAGDRGTEASALNNLSREFQLMGAPRVALRLADEAVSILREHAYGSYSFYMALCHRAHLHRQLNHPSLSMEDYEEALPAEFPEIQGALVVVRQWLLESGLSVPAVPAKEVRRTSVPTWEERKESPLRSPVELSDLESQLLQELAAGPKDRHALIQALWGEGCDFFHLENRLKQLIHRFRKKERNLISFAEGRYYLTERPLG